MSSNNSIRKLVIGDSVYLWGVAHQHNHGHHHEQGCREIFTAYLEGQKAAPLRIWFSEEDATRMAAGVVADGAAGPLTNLNEPKTARRLIDAARVAGWTPESARTPFVVEDGLALLRDVHATQ
ncbi:MAG: hypothetical protein IPK60_06580 [Sandaracinaceae bacterium]|nr:hypothetical protein [Sandaracinaceae bacterium]